MLKWICARVFNGDKKKWGDRASEFGAAHRIGSETRTEIRCFLARRTRLVGEQRRRRCESQLLETAPVWSREKMASFFIGAPDSATTLRDGRVCGHRSFTSEDLQRPIAPRRRGARALSERDAECFRSRRGTAVRPSNSERNWPVLVGEKLGVDRNRGQN
jgi:hypothetical protein